MAPMGLLAAQRMGDRIRAAGEKSFAKSKLGGQIR